MVLFYYGLLLALPIVLGFLAGLVYGTVASPWRLAAAVMPYVLLAAAVLALGSPVNLALAPVIWYALGFGGGRYIGQMTIDRKRKETVPRGVARVTVVRADRERPL